jgi:oligopeptide/dipeptide ABC transporter ATP-binding protein
MRSIHGSSSSVPSARPSLLDVENLRVHFLTRTGTVRAVDGIHYSVGYGETLGLVGESGSGKTVSCLALLRLTPPPAQIVGGRVCFEGRDLLTIPGKDMRAVRGKRIAMVFQNPAYSLNPILSVGEQLGEIFAWHEKVSRREARDRVAELLRLVGITDPLTRLDQLPHELSAGMKQRVCIARALLCNPTLLLADEPTTNLDATIQAQILALLHGLKERSNASMILVAHDMGVLARMADRITVMYAGRICETADTRTLFRNPQHPYTRALLESVPRIDRSYTKSRAERLPTIAGRSPSLSTPPTGCRFHPRCPEAAAECRHLQPQLTPVAAGHVVSCLRRGSQGARTQ